MERNGAEWSDFISPRHSPIIPPMAYTTTDLDNVRAARLALAQGNRIGSVQVGDKTINYATVRDSELAAFEAEIVAALAEAERLANASTRRRYFMLSSGKGL